MAVEPTQITQTLPSPQLTGITTAYTEKLAPLIGQQIGTGTYTGQQFVAPESQLQQQARALAPGLGGYQQYLTAAQAATGPDAYKSYLSPYQTDVIQATEDLLNRQRQQGLGALSAQAIGSGAFGGAREGIARGEYEASRDLQDAQILSQLRQQGFTQAQQLAGQQFAQQSQLAQLQPQLLGTQISGLGQLGGQEQAQQQALLTAQQQAAREAAFEPFTRLGLVGQQISQLSPGALPAQVQTLTQPQAPASPFSSALGIGAGLAGLGGKLGIFG
jgi:hypothetical protein